MLVIYGVLLRTDGRYHASRAGRICAGAGQRACVSFAKLPNGASLDRTEQVLKDMGEMVMQQPGAAHAVAFPGLRSMD